MAYTNSWDETAPAGTDAISSGDNEIRQFKLDIRERLNTLLAGGSALANNTDPMALNETTVVGDGGEEDISIRFDGNAQDWHIGIDDSADALVIGLGSVLGATEQLSFTTTTITFNEDGGNYDFRIESVNNPSMFLVDAGENTVSIGGAAPTSHGVDFIVQPPARTADANEEYYVVAIIPTTAVTIPSGSTSALVASLYISKPTATPTGILTAAATLYIKEPADAGNSNYAIWVDAGNVRFDGDLELPAGGITTTKSVSGTSFDGLIVENTSGGISDGARIRLIAANPGGDPYISFSSGAQVISVGIDQSDSDLFKISDASTLGSNDRLTMDTSQFVLGLDLNIAGNFIVGTEMTAPGAPGSNQGRIYFEDTGGKTQLMVIFASGAAQQIAVEP